MLKAINIIIFTAILIGTFKPSFSFAIDGYDNWHHTKITIVAGDKIAVGEDIGIYIWNKRRLAAVEIDNITQRGNDLELEVTEKKDGVHYFFEISADDPGIDSLPHFDPGLPYPEILTPEVHMNYDLLKARGNMIERGNGIEAGNQIELFGEKIESGNLIENNTRTENEHILYQGLQPVQ